MKHKVGDKVRVKSKRWYEENKDSYGNVNIPCTFVPPMSELCGKIVTIKRVLQTSYDIKENDFSWTDEMFDNTLQCSFCQGDDINNNGGHMGRNNNIMYVNDVTFAINYCPFCGEKIK